VAADHQGTQAIGGAEPQNRSEEDVRGYRMPSRSSTVMADLAVTPDTLRRLHALAQRAAGDAGEWKRVGNDIIEWTPTRRPSCVPSGQGGRRTGSGQCAVTAYRGAVAQARAPHLVLVAGLVLDFLCIHPFRDGNGRVARLGARPAGRNSKRSTKSSAYRSRRCARLSTSESSRARVTSARPPRTAGVRRHRAWLVSCDPVGLGA
jgi:hypothetical protein